MLRGLVVAVPMGLKAQAGWAAYEARYALQVHTLPTWHPSPRVSASRHEILDLGHAASLLAAA